MSGVYINLGKKERELRFSFLSLKALEQHYNKPVQKVLDEELNSGKLSAVVTVIWACLRKEKLSISKVEELIDDSIEEGEIGLNELIEKLTEAINESAIIKSTKQDESDESKN